MSSVLVSVIIPTRDRADTLPLAIKSVQAQTEARWECLVVDDHSQDGSAQLIRDLARDDKRISYLPLGTGARGANAARNLGLARARGEFVVFLDSDDALAPFCLAERLAALADFPELDFAVFPTLLFRETPGDRSILWNVETPENDLDRFLALDIPWQTTGVFWKRSGLEKQGRWQEDLPGWQDWEFHVRALIRKLNYRRCGRPDSFWREPRADSLWNRAKDPVHLQARIALLGRTVQELHRADMLGLRQRRRLAALYFWHGRLWYLLSRDRLKAAATWGQACRLGLVGPLRFWRDFDGFSRVTRGPSEDLQIVFPSWPADYFLNPSATLHKMPYPASAICA